MEDISLHANFSLNDWVLLIDVMETSSSGEKRVNRIIVSLCDCSSSGDAPQWFSDLSNSLLLTQKVMAVFLVLHTGRNSPLHTVWCVKCFNWLIFFFDQICLLLISFSSGDLPQLCSPLSAFVEKESIQQHLVVPHSACDVGYYVICMLFRIHLYYFFIIYHLDDSKYLSCVELHVYCCLLLSHRLNLGLYLMSWVNDATQDHGLQINNTIKLPFVLSLSTSSLLGQIVQATVDYLLWCNQSNFLTFHLGDIPLRAWLLVSLSLLLVVVVNEVVKLHEIRYEAKINIWVQSGIIEETGVISIYLNHKLLFVLIVHFRVRVRYQKRQKLQFETKLGMNSPFWYLPSEEVGVKAIPRTIQPVLETREGQGTNTLEPSIFTLAQQHCSGGDINQMLSWIFKVGLFSWSRFPKYYFQIEKSEK